MNHAQAQDDAIVVAAQASTEPTSRTRATGKRAQGKRFECTHPGCDKRFTRMEHMQRHALNHTAVDSHCPRCNLLFKRPDLLERHMNRHIERDAEAGGPGHGVLDTRKRAWKGPDGSVIDKRPRVDTVSNTPPRGSHAGFETSGQVVSPPVSDEGRYTHMYNFGGEDDEGPAIFAEDFENSSSLAHSAVPTSFFHNQYDELPLSTTSTRPKPYTAPTDESFDYHPAFQPDTASSFNMPYTTALDYNWLFNLETATASGFGLHSGGGMQDPVVFPEYTSLAQPSYMNADPPAPDHTPQSQSTSWRSVIENTPGEDLPSSSTTSPNGSAAGTRPTVGQRKETTQLNMPRGADPRSKRPRKTADNLDRSRPQNDGLPRRSLDDRRYSKSEHPLSMISPSVSLPQVDEATRSRLLNVIQTASPQIPDELSSSELCAHPLLSLASLQSWLDLYFVQFNTTYPLIHLFTFEPNTAEPLHLLSMILLGATYADKSAHQLAVCIHDVIRPSIFSHAGFSPSPQLWTLQTILLVECFGKSRAGQKQHDMSHLFHGLLINLIRRSDCQSITKMPSPPAPAADGDAPSLHDAWGKWAVLEQKKRLALLCFMWDTQHAVLFCQSLCMSAFELRCSMPCDQELWEAPNAESWAETWRESSSPSLSSTTTGPLFLPILKAYLTSGARASDPALNAPNILSLALVLHGIMSISWDMQRRDQTSLGVSSTLGVYSWRDTLSKAYDVWKADFDQYCQTCAAKSGEGVRAEWSSFHAAYGAIYYAAQTLLNLDFLDVQIYAGARSILGRPVQQRDYLRSSKIVKRWAATDRVRAAVAAYHSAAMLRTVVTGKGTISTAVEPGLSSSATDTNLFHVPWCLYTATLTCWAFHHARPSRRDRDEDSRGRQGHDDNGLSGDDSDINDEIVWDSYKEMETLLKDMAGTDDSDTAVKSLLAGQGRKGTNGLVWVVADVLSKVRWGIVHAGVVVLRGLVPMRLINQYETI